MTASPCAQHYQIASRKIRMGSLAGRAPAATGEEDTVAAAAWSLTMVCSAAMG